MRSRSLEPLSGLAMWSDTVEYIDLLKGDTGLGFSILDYLVSGQYIVFIVLTIISQEYIFSAEMLLLIIVKMK